MGSIISGLLLAWMARIDGVLAADVGSLIQNPAVLLGAAVVVALSVGIALALVLRGPPRKRINQDAPLPTRRADFQRASNPPATPANWRATSLIDQADLPDWLKPQPQGPVPPPPPAAVPQRPSAEQVQPRISSSGRLVPGVELQKRYRVERAIAAGGMGAVYRAYDQNLQHVCAVKEMLERFNTEQERQQGLAWFRREAHMLLNLHHPAIPRIFDSFAEEGRHYLVMDFIEGRTLAEVLAQEGQPRGLPEARVRRWALQLCQVLIYLHRQQPPVIFRDLKPANIMVTNKDEIRLIDFGIARIFQEGTGTVVMTPGFAPLEQMAGNPEPRSDLYALGATLYQLLSLRNPRDNKPAIFDFAPIRQLRPEISPGFASIIFRAVQRSPSDRWASAGEMEQALRRLGSG